MLPRQLIPSPSTVLAAKDIMRALMKAEETMLIGVKQTGDSRLRFGEVRT